MSLGQINQPYGINYTSLDQDDSLFVRATIFDVSAGFPGTLITTVNLANTTPGSYDGLYNFTMSGKLYKIAMAVYTDGTYSTVDPDFAPQSDMVQTVDETGGGGSTVVLTVNTVKARLLNVKPTGARILEA